MQNKIEPVHLAAADENLPLQPPGRAQLLFLWTAATTLGWFVFNLYFLLLLANRLTVALSRPPGPDTSLAVLLVLLPEGVSQGLILGLAQWYVLRRYVKLDLRWVVVSVLGWTIVSVLYFGSVSAPAVQPALSRLGDSGALLLLAVIRGLAVGACQWLALRRWGPRTWLWLPVVVVAQVANLLVSRLFSDPALSSVLGWIAYDLLTGLGLVALLHASWPNLLATGQAVEY